MGADVVGDVVVGRITDGDAEGCSVKGPADGSIVGAIGQTSLGGSPKSL